MQFDFISDLHLEQWQDNTRDWKGLGTSLTCVVAGDVSKDFRMTLSFLKHLSNCYQHVLFVDGNHEHYRNYNRITDTQDEIEHALKSLSNVTYLADSAFVVNKTAFIGSNGWWSFDFPELNGLNGRLECMEMFCAKEDYDMRDAINIWSMAQEQATFLSDVVASMQEEDQVQEIIIVTHTLPRADLIIPTFDDMVDWSKAGNAAMKQVLEYDINGKISTWCFGHMHDQHVDTRKDGVRYISHPRGRPDDAVFPIYYPKRIDTQLDKITQF